MTSVETDHYLRPDGLERMELTLGVNGPVLVTASVADTGWIIEADGQPSASAADRTSAIQTMNDMSLLVRGVSGASLFVPPEMVGLP